MTALTGAWFMVLWFAVDAPIILGWTIIDGPDPNHPGHMKGMYPSPMALLFRIALLVTCFVVASKLKPRDHQNLKISIG